MDMLAEIRRPRSQARPGLFGSAVASTCDGAGRDRSPRRRRTGAGRIELNPEALPRVLVDNGLCQAA